MCKADARQALTARAEVVQRHGGPRRQGGQEQGKTPRRAGLPGWPKTMGQAKKGAMGRVAQQETGGILANLTNSCTQIVVRQGKNASP